MTTRLARRTARSAALVAVAAAAAFSLTACQSGGKDAAGPEKKDSVAAASASLTGNGGVVSDSKTSTDKSQITTEAASPFRTQTLPDGSKAEIYKVGDQNYRARIVNRGSLLATMETHDTDAGLDANDMFIELGMDGTVHSWMGGGHQGPGTFKVAGGWKVKVTKIGDVRFRAQIIGHDGVAATLNANQHDVGVNANGIYMVLSDGGVLSAHS
ncbi:MULTISPECIES: hypothetical protein [unclassified Streptomyces]|uniref:hypothetical protein n=1 Tax=unclassified Streptomyces TaxID=2593676 RepID=UPI00324C7807